MVFAHDFLHDFYYHLRNERVLIFVALNVDALCACKIVQHLFKCDQILYTTVPVTGFQDLERAYNENMMGVSRVLFINCGASTDLYAMLDPSPATVFFLMDSHRPIDVHNIFDLRSVRVILNEREMKSLNIPPYDDLFRDDDNDESSDNCDENEEDEASEERHAAKRRRRMEPEYLERQRAKRIWSDNRERLIFEYSQFSQHGRSSAFTAYELAWKMSRDTNDLLWLAIIGVTDQWFHKRICWDDYFQWIMDLNNHATRHNHHRNADEGKVSVECLKLKYGEELWLSLLSHWTVYDSLCHSHETACKLRVWSLKGRNKLHEFLADMGLPLVQAKQKFSALDQLHKAGLKKMFQDHLEKYGFNAQDLFVPTFVANYGYRGRYSAKDVVVATSSTLEYSGGAEGSAAHATVKDRYQRAMEILDRKASVLEKVIYAAGIELAKAQLTFVVNQTHSFLDLQQIFCAGPFLYGFIDAGNHCSELFTQPLCLQQLARFALEAYCAGSAAKAKARCRKLPLVLGACRPAAEDDAAGGGGGTPAQIAPYVTMVGIPPLCEDLGRNFFGKAFEQAAITAKARMIADNFDSNMIEVHVEDKTRFLDALISTLT